jgi:hypothetical protein
VCDSKECDGHEQEEREALEERVAELEAEVARLRPLSETQQALMTLCQDQGEMTTGERVDDIVRAFLALRFHHGESVAQLRAEVARLTKLTGDEHDVLVAMKRERDEALAEVARLKARFREYAEAASAIGIAYEADGMNTEPGPVESIVAEVKRLQAIERDRIEFAADEVALVVEALREQGDYYTVDGYEDVEDGRGKAMLALARKLSGGG